MDVIKIANYIRQSASNNYQNKIGVLNKDSKITDLSNPLMEYSTIRNEFAQGLINVIGETILNRIATFENPLAKFKRGTIGLGIDTREIARGLTTGFDYEFTTEGIAKMFDLYLPEVAECFHRLNRRRIFPLTFSDKELKLALHSWEDLRTFIDEQVVILYETNYQEEYELMLELIRASVNSDGIKTIEIDKVVDESTGKSFVKVVKNVAKSFLFRDNANSPYGRKNPKTKIMPVAKTEDIALITEYTTINEIKVDVLATAFNKDEVAFSVENVTEVGAGALGFIMDDSDSENVKYYKIDAVVCDKNWFRVLDDADNEVNGNDLPTARAYNRYLHVWQTLSTSPFMCVNALVHKVESTDIPDGYFDKLIGNDEVVDDNNDVIGG